MKFYSEVLEKFFDTEKECLKAERAHQDAIREKEELERQKSAKRKADAQKVEAARIALGEAKKNYEKVLNEFCKEHGSYHYSISTPTDPTNLTDCLNALFGW